MSAMMFAYAQARQIEIELDVKRMYPTDSMSMRDRLGRTLIALGEQLVSVPPVSPGVTTSVRRAA